MCGSMIRLKWRTIVAAMSSLGVTSSQAPPVSRARLRTKGSATALPDEAVIFAAETCWNVVVARIFSLDRTRARYISLKTVIDRAFGGVLALLGLKIAAT